MWGLRVNGHRKKNQKPIFLGGRPQKCRSLTLGRPPSPPLFFLSFFPQDPKKQSLVWGSMDPLDTQTKLKKPKYTFLEGGGPGAARSLSLV